MMVVETCFVTHDSVLYDEIASVWNHFELSIKLIGEPKKDMLLPAPGDTDSIVSHASMVLAICSKRGTDQYQIGDQNGRLTLVIHCFRMEDESQWVDIAMNIHETALSE